MDGRTGGKRTVSYRGNLKSCNYRCSYCPFSKHRSTAAELEKDRQNFLRFCDSVEERETELSIGAVFVVPYGEASVHRWYWEGLGRLAALSGIDRVGMQTNLSFSVEQCLGIFDLCSGENPWKARGKLCIWATFHPEMAEADVFAEKCRRLAESGVNLCAGAVGVPENIPLLGRLREMLSPDIYLWINKMDGLGRVYTEEERAAFSALDPFFEDQLGSPRADAVMCGDRCFVEADGRVHACNISRTKEANWYGDGAEEIFRPLCGKKNCTCYLAYGGRADFRGRQFFGEYPIFRIPKKARAIFLDLDGTLVPEGYRGELPDRVRRTLGALGRKRYVFLATSLPEEEVRKRIKGDMYLFHGAVFASGAHVRLWGRKWDREEGGESRRKNERWRDGAAEVGEKGSKEQVNPLEAGQLSELGEVEENWSKEQVNPLEAGQLSELRKFAEGAGARMRIYRKNGIVYKVTLVKPSRSVWKGQELQGAAVLLAGADCRVFAERHCLEIIGKGLDKGTGVREICGWLGIRPEEALALGNGREDEAMERVCRGGFEKAADHMEGN